MKNLKCGCIHSYHLCPVAKKIYISIHDQPKKFNRKKMWEKIHKHWKENEQ